MRLMLDDGWSGAGLPDSWDAFFTSVRAGIQYGNIHLDCSIASGYIRIIPAHRGASPETRRRRSGEWRPAAAGSYPADSGGSGPRPPGTMTWLRGARWTDSGGNSGNGSADPGQKSPRWSAERRARLVLQAQDARHASQAWLVAPRKRDRLAPSRRSAPRLGRRKKEKRGARARYQRAGRA